MGDDASFVEYSINHAELEEYWVDVKSRVQYDVDVGSLTDNDSFEDNGDLVGENPAWIPLEVTPLQKNGELVELGLSAGVLICWGRDPDKEGLNWVKLLDQGLDKVLLLKYWTEDTSSLECAVDHWERGKYTVESRALYDVDVESFADTDLLEGNWNWIDGNSACILLEVTPLYEDDTLVELGLSTNALLCCGRDSESLELVL